MELVLREPRGLGSMHELCRLPWDPGVEQPDVAVAIRPDREQIVRAQSAGPAQRGPSVGAVRIRVEGYCKIVKTQPFSVAGQSQRNIAPRQRTVDLQRGALVHAQLARCQAGEWPDRAWRADRAGIVAQLQGREERTELVARGQREMFDRRVVIAARSARLRSLWRIVENVVGRFGVGLEPQSERSGRRRNPHASFELALIAA